MNQHQPVSERLGRPESPRSFTPPPLAYQPPRPRTYRPPIALVGAGGISKHHLNAYRQMGLTVAVICDIDLDRAKERRDAFFPEAAVTGDAAEAIGFPGIEVVDITTHPKERVALVETALRAGKHVLSQKPFVLDLGDGEYLADLAERQGVLLAVNQNGRWAPHFRYLESVVRAGLLGPLASIDLSLQWDHTWTEHSPFNEIHHLLLYDFAIHWFDIMTLWMGDQQAERVFASVRHTEFQTARPPFLAHAVVDYPHAQARLTLNAQTQHGQRDQSTVAGRDGTVRAWGPDLNRQQVELTTAQGTASPQLSGQWFDCGFEGTMGELLCAIEEGREPSHAARRCLPSLALCFAAIASANEGRTYVPGEVRRCPS